MRSNVSIDCLTNRVFPAGAILDRTSFPDDEQLTTPPPSLKILVVGEDYDSPQSIHWSLRHMNYYEPQITTATNTAAANFALRSDKFSVAIVDGAIAERLEIEAITTKIVNRRVASILIVDHATRVEQMRYQKAFSLRLDRRYISPSLIQFAILQAMERNKMQTCYE